MLQKVYPDLVSDLENYCGNYFFTMSGLKNYQRSENFERRVTAKHAR